MNEAGVVIPSVQVSIPMPSVTQPIEENRPQTCLLAAFDSLYKPPEEKEE